jgi:hypothetical protein
LECPSTVPLTKGDYSGVSTLHFNLPQPLLGRLSIFSDCALRQARGERKKSMTSKPLPLRLSLSKPGLRIYRHSRKEGNPWADGRIFLSRRL